MMEVLTDGQTDPQNFGQYNIIPSPLFVEGHKKLINRHKFGSAKGLFMLTQHSWGGLDVVSKLLKTKHN